MYIGPDEIFTFFMVLLSICGGVTTVWGAVKVFKDVRKPAKERNDRLEDYEDRLIDAEEALDELSYATPIILKALTLIIEHMVTGDGVDELKKCQDDISIYLINQIGKKGRKNGSR